MSDVGFARAPWWGKLLFLLCVSVLEYCPVVMTAGRRRSLLNDAGSLDLAMQEIERLRNVIRKRCPDRDDA